jgi:hypothetical protein
MVGGCSYLWALMAFVVVWLVRACGCAVRVLRGGGVDVGEGGWWRWGGVGGVVLFVVGG